MAGVTAEAPPRPRSRRLGRRILAGLIAGIAVGVFLGERARVFETAADAFVKLLQMAVLPYVTVSIIGSIGALRLEDVRTLGTRAALVLLGLWALALTFAFLMPLTFPPTQSGSFFSTTLLERPPPFDIVELYIPANPFFALANNVVPAVVLFSIVVGVALIGLPRKQLLLDVLDTASNALARAMRFVVRLTPYGVFAIAAYTAGTLRVEQASRLEVYLISYAALALLLALWVLPGLVGALTPIPARAVFSATRDALFTATIAGDLFIVLPLLITACKDLVSRYTGESGTGRTLPDVIVPVSYNFPHSGKLLSVSFILFAGWFSDASVHPADYPRLGLTSIVTLFGSINAAMPFLLDLFRVPADTFQLFVASGVINSRFGTLVAALHTVAMALLGTCAVTGALRWRPVAVIRYAVITIALTAIVIVGIRSIAATLLAQPAPPDVLGEMRVSQRTDAVMLTAAAPPAVPAPPGARLRSIRAGHVLRVGLLADALPFAYVNAHDELVGLDVALMHRLALAFGARLEFVPIGRDALDRPDGAAELLRQGTCDIIAGGMAVTTDRAGSMHLSTPYMDETLAFVVADASRRRFQSWDAIRAGGALTIAVPDVSYYVDEVREQLPDAHLRKVHAIGDLFGPSRVNADAMVLPAERGSAWTLRFPQYSVVVPSPHQIKIPLAYAMPLGEPELAAFVDTWLELNARNGSIEDLYQYWILGRAAATVAPRWSIIRDVLHWVT